MAIMTAEPAVLAATWAGPNILPIDAQSNLVGTTADQKPESSRILFPSETQSSIMAAPVLIAQSIPFPTGELSLPQFPAFPKIVPTLRNLKPSFGGVAGGVGGALLMDLLFPAPAGPDESKFIRQPSTVPIRPRTPTTPSAPTPVQTAVPTPPVPVKSSAPSALNALEQQQRQWDQQQRQQQQRFEQQQAAFQAQQAAQKQLWAQQDNLRAISTGFTLSPKAIETFIQQLSPAQKKALQQETNHRYQAYVNLATQAGNTVEPHEQADIRQQLQQQALYQNYIPVREINHFGSSFWGLAGGDSGYTPQRMQQVRGYFDQVFEGKYSKLIPAENQVKILQSADAQYRKETGKAQVDRNSLLWKTYRNIQATEKFPDLWDQLRTDLSHAEAGIRPTVVGSKDPNLGSNALNRPSQVPALDMPNHTGHSQQQRFDPNKGHLSPSPALSIPNHTGHNNAEKPAVTHVFEYTTDYRKNYEQFYGQIPDGSQIHHLAPRAVFRDSQLAQEWAQRGMTKLDYPENLIALPQTKNAYDKSRAKIQHSGSHKGWNAHAERVLNEAQKNLVGQYGSLDKVPENVMRQTKDSVMKELREDLLDKDLGIDEGWIIPGKEGMDRVSQFQVSVPVG
jgi:A nuclease family of the HNH/ENDO VII superfamily with conserved AHH